MAEITKIAWTDATFNPWIGCSKVAAGCTHCYAEAFAKRTGKAKWGDQGTRVKTSEAYWREPLKWNAKAAKEGVRKRVFCASMADVFEDWDGVILDHKGNALGAHADGCLCPVEQRPERPASMDNVRRYLFALIDATPNLDWLLLTKRPENIQRMTPNARYMPPGDHFKLNHYRHNAWLGCSVAEQHDANRNVPHLLRCRDLAPVLFVSYEPAIEAVDWTAIEPPPSLQHSPSGGLRFDALKTNDARYFESDAHLDWIIVGGESGHGARPFRMTWALDTVRQCADAGVACFVKQMGSNVEEGFGGNRKVFLQQSKGDDPAEWPEALRVREFPRREAERLAGIEHGVKPMSEAKVKEHGMLFAGEMVRALLDGRKTMTRRIAKLNESLFRDEHPDLKAAAIEAALKICPIKVGERIWVREAFAMKDNDPYRIAYKADGERVGIIHDGSGGWSRIHHGWVLGVADNSLSGEWVGRTYYGPWKPSIHMHRHMSRITLEVTGVRVERVQDITPDDVAAEGFPPDNGPMRDGMRLTAHGRTLAFAEVWGKMNGHETWDNNCWVWVYSFKVLQ